MIVGKFLPSSGDFEYWLVERTDERNAELFLLLLRVREALLPIFFFELCFFSSYFEFWESGKLLRCIGCLAP